MPTGRTSAPGAAHRCLDPSAVVTLVSAVLALTGCAVGPQYVKPALNVNDSWSVTGGPKISAQSAADSAWWKTFNDPVLEQLIQLAYSQNLTLQVAGLRIMESRAVLGIAIGNQYPQLQQAFATASRVGLSENNANALGIHRYYWDAQIGFDVAWEADFWQKYGGAVKSQTAAYMSSVADYQNALVSLSAEVARTYTAVRTFEALIEQSIRNVGIQQESLRIADVRFRNGATSELDVVQARTLLESTRASIPQLELSLAQSQNALSTLLGQPTGSLQKVLQGPRAIPGAPAQVAVSIPAEVLRRRPDIRSAELLAMAQSERIGVAKADLYPRFVLAGALGYQAFTGGSSDSLSLVKSSNLFFEVGPRLYWPFFNYDRIENQVRVEDARFQEVVVTYQNSVLKAAQEVEDGIVGFLKALEATSAQENAVAAARRSVDISFLQYREGAVDFQRVLDAQRSQLQEENNLVRLRSTVATNVISLYKALGGGWEMSVGQPVITEPARAEMEKRTDWGDLLSVQHQTPAPSKESPPPPQR